MPPRNPIPDFLTIVSVDTGLVGRSTGVCIARIPAPADVRAPGDVKSIEVLHLFALDTGRDQSSAALLAAFRSRVMPVLAGLAPHEIALVTEGSCISFYLAKSKSKQRRGAGRAGFAPNKVFERTNDLTRMFKAMGCTTIQLLPNQKLCTFARGCDRGRVSCDAARVFLEAARAGGRCSAGLVEFFDGLDRAHDVADAITMTLYAVVVRTYALLGKKAPPGGARAVRSRAEAEAAGGALPVRT
jgi:hypothetical protein